MTAVTDEAVDLANDDFYGPDVPKTGPDPGHPPPEQAGPGPDTITDKAPYGYTQDRRTGQWRPKLSPGRPRTPKSPAELAAEPPPELPAPDEAPGPPRPPAAPTDDDVPMPRGGTIAKGVNRLYRRIGRIARAMDHDIGQAIIASTRAEDPDDVTVGDAWENLCRGNVRIRAFVLNALKGGAWQDLAMAHGPIVAAIFAKEWVINHLPVINMLAGWFAHDDDQDGDDQDGDDRGPRLEAADIRAMAATAEDSLRKAAGRAGAGVTISRLAAKLADGSASPADLEHLDPELVKAATAMAQRGIPPGFRRQQPKTRSRAKRRH